MPIPMKLDQLGEGIPSAPLDNTRPLSKYIIVAPLRLWIYTAYKIETIVVLAISAEQAADFILASGVDYFDGNMTSDARTYILRTLKSYDLTPGLINYW